MYWNVTLPASCNWLWVNAFSSWFIAWGTHIIWTSYLVRRVYVHGVQSSMEKYSCESLGTHTVSLYCHYILVRPFQIDLLFLGPPSQKFGVGRSTWKWKKWISLKNLSKRVAKLLLQLHLTIDLPFSTVELRFTVTLNQAKLLTVTNSAFNMVCTVIILIMALYF